MADHVFQCRDFLIKLISPESTKKSRIEQIKKCSLEEERILEEILINYSRYSISEEIKSDCYILLKSGINRTPEKIQEFLIENIELICHLIQPALIYVTELQVGNLFAAGESQVD
jgi:hypothetical protein